MRTIESLKSQESKLRAGQTAAFNQYEWVKMEGIDKKIRMTLDQIKALEEKTTIQSKT